MRVKIAVVIGVIGVVSSHVMGQTTRETIARDPYIGAIVIDANSGETIVQVRPDIPGYPASTLKLMNLLLVQERINAGKLALTDMVSVSKTAANMGGSQVYLDTRETFTLEDMLYAMIIQSANDASVAIAEHIAGSREAFVKLMNQRAQELGMVNTRFTTVHGLPPSGDQMADVSTARDMAILGRELCKHRDIFNYTSATYRQLRADTTRPFDMRTHNPFLKEKMPGCDGMKTGYTFGAGWSIVVSIQRNNRRLIAVVLGSSDRKLRDAKARELIEQAINSLP